MATSGGPGSPTPQNNPNSGPPSPSGGSPAVSEPTARRLAVALELLRRQLQLGGNVPAAFTNRDRGGASPVTMAALAAASRGGWGAGASPSNNPQPVVVVGWRAGAINVNVAGGRGAAAGLDEKNEKTDDRRRQGGGFRWDAMWAKLKDPGKTPPAGEEKKEKEWANMGTGVAKALARQFLVVIGPLTALSTILGSANSGMSAFSKAVSIFGATLAPILLPAVVLLSAALLTVSDIIWGKLVGGLKEFDRVILSSVVAGFDNLSDGIDDMLEACSRYVDFVRGLTGGAIGGTKGKPAADGVTAGATGGSGGAKKITAEDILKGFFGGTGGGSSGGFGGFFGGVLGSRSAPAAPTNGAPQPPAPALSRREIRERERQLREGGDPGGRSAQGDPGKGNPAAPPKGLGDRMRENIGDVMTSLVRSMLPKAEYTTGAAVAKARQLAGANQDPLDAKLFRRYMETIQNLLAAGNGELKKGNAPPANPVQTPDGR